MSKLFEKSIHTLELDQVLDRLAECAVTEEGKERCRKLTPMADKIIHAHIARMVGRVFPKDAAEDEGYLRFLSALKKGGYKGSLSLEAFCPEEFYPAAKRGLCVLREASEKAGF